MNLQTACEMIGIQEKATLDELNERLRILEKEASTPARLQDIHKAYKLIYSHITQEKTKPKESFRKKADNFFYHYKYHVIFGLLLIILAGSFLYTFIGNQIGEALESGKSGADIEIMLFGDYEDEDLSPLKDKIKDLFPDWEQVDIDLVYAPSKAHSQEDMATMQKNQVTMAKAKPDLYIFDLHYFNQFLDNGPFLALDQFENIGQAEGNLQIHQQESDDREHIYGIDLTNNELFSGLKIAADEKIAVIRSKSKRKQNALALMQEVLKK